MKPVVPATKVDAFPWRAVLRLDLGRLELVA